MEKRSDHIYSEGSLVRTIYGDRKYIIRHSGTSHKVGDGPWVNMYQLWPCRRGSNKADMRIWNSHRYSAGLLEVSEDKIILITEKEDEKK